MNVPWLGWLLDHTVETMAGCSQSRILSCPVHKPLSASPSIDSAELLSPSWLQQSSRNQSREHRMRLTCLPSLCSYASQDHLPRGSPGWALLWQSIIEKMSYRVQATPDTQAVSSRQEPGQHTCLPPFLFVDLAVPCNSHWPFAVPQGHLAHQPRSRGP